MLKVFPLTALPISSLHPHLLLNPPPQPTAIPLKSSLVTPGLTEEYPVIKTLHISGEGFLFLWKLPRSWCELQEHGDFCGLHRGISHTWDGAGHRTDTQVCVECMIPVSQDGFSKKSRRQFKVAVPSASEHWLCHGRDWAMPLMPSPSRDVESNPIYLVTMAAKDRAKRPLTPQVRQPQVTATVSGPGRVAGLQERDRQGSTSEKKMKGSLV